MSNKGELKPAHELLVGLETSRGWGPVHFAECARKWLYCFAENGKEKELREMEDKVRAALYHGKWAELGEHEWSLFASYNYKKLYDAGPCTRKKITV